MHSSEKQQANLGKTQQNITYKQLKETLSNQTIGTQRFQQLYLKLTDQPLIQHQSDNLESNTGYLNSTQFFVLRSQKIAYKHLMRNLCTPQVEDRAHKICQKKQVGASSKVCHQYSNLRSNYMLIKLILSKTAEKMNLDELFIQGGFFNLKSSETERIQKIGGLLKKRDGGEVRESELPNNNAVNKLLTRTDQEYKQFTYMEEERYTRESKIYSHFLHPKQGKDSSFNQRLIGKDQVPEWLIYASKPEKQVNQLEKGARERKKINYNDYEIIDLQLFDMLEQEYEASIIAKKNNKTQCQVVKMYQHKSIDQVQQQCE